MDKYICIHGHFYQPPRENAWLEEVELQDSAYPYHDWNERITAECYAPNTASRILDTDGRITDIVNNYSKISFNFGPTLLLWMERHRPETYRAVLEADRLSMEIFSGHGSALAQAYHHMIMPLANRRDKYTQILWGIRDFEHRFKRFPEGIWLPETAVDVNTLEILADFGILFSILAPHQARRVRELKRNARWKGVAEGTIDTTMAYLCRLPSGNKITVFFYDGKISREVAFGGLLGNGEAFAKKLMGAFSEERKNPQLVSIATDGETYGHHHRGGDMALAYCLNYIESKKLVKLTNYAEYLANHPPSYEVAIHENSSWSCIHGIERWRDNCGCHSGTHPEWTQQWRRPLREALDELRFSAINLYEEGTAELLTHPWNARDEYISVVLDRSEENVQGFLQKHASRELSPEEQVRCLQYLEMQRNAMMMYTSCGWFFDEISGIETVQIMQYASRVIQLAMDVAGVSLEDDFLEGLACAPSNVYENGRKPYEMFVRPAAVDLLRVAVHYAVSSVFHEYPAEMRLFCFHALNEEYDCVRRNGDSLATGKARIISGITGNEKVFSFAVFFSGHFNIVAGVKEYAGDESFRNMQGALKQEFEQAGLTGADSSLRNYFQESIYSFSYLFRDEQRKIIRQIMDEVYAGIDTSCRKLFDDYREMMAFFRSLDVQVPRPFTVAAEYILNRDLKKIFEGDIDVEKLDSLTKEIKQWSIEIDTATIGYVASGKITSLMEQLAAHPEDTSLIETIENALKLMSTLPVELDLWKAQNIYFSIGEKIYAGIPQAGETPDESRHRWLEAFRKLGYYLHVKIAL